ncbi:MAG: TetR family transcriptional regulator [Gemmatimonadota bacterium]
MSLIRPSADRDRERNAPRSRESILDAAEELFADKGFGSTSLEEVGLRAGVSRATPGYFFGSKPALYHAVLERCLEQVRIAVRSGRERALASGESAEVVLAGAVGEYFDFITSHRNFVRLMEWEALSGGAARHGVPPHLEAAREALSAIGAELDLAPDGEAAQLLLSIIGLCWFPLVHSSTVMEALELDPATPAFVAARRQHVIDLVVHGLKGRLAASSSNLEGTRS